MSEVTKANKVRNKGHIHDEGKIKERRVHFRFGPQRQAGCSLPVSKELLKTKHLEA